MYHKRILKSILVCAVWPAFFCPVVQAEKIIGISKTAINFTLPEWYTRQPTSLYDFAGQIVLLDFFVYWCPHCQASSPEIETYIQDYYEARGGNPAGIPVQVLSISVEPGNPASTEAFIRRYGLDLALDDGSRTVYSNYSLGGVPLFVLINGAANANKPQWEILAHFAGYAPGDYGYLRYFIDSVTPEPATALILATGIISMPCRKRRASSK